MMISFSANARLHKIARVYCVREAVTMARIVADGIQTLRDASQVQAMIDGVIAKYPAKEARKNVTIKLDDESVHTAWALGFQQAKDIRDIYSAALYWGTKLWTDKEKQ